MQNLIEKIARYEKAVQGLCDKIEEYVSFVVKNVPAEYRHEFGVEEICRGSQVSWWSAVSSDNRPIHSDVEKAGSFIYAGRDFNYPITRATRREIVEFAKALPGYIKNAEAWLDKQAEIAEAHG